MKLTTNLIKLATIVLVASFPLNALADQADEAAKKFGAATPEKISEYAKAGRQITTFLQLHGYSFTIDMMMLTGPMISTWIVAYDNDMTAELFSNPTRVAVYTTGDTSQVDCIDVSTNARRKTSREEC